MERSTHEVSADSSDRAMARAKLGNEAEEAGQRSLERLRDRIDTAAQEITRLRRQNAELAQRIISLESGEHDYASLLASGEDAEALKRKINNFMNAIDSYLNEGSNTRSDRQTE